MAIVPKTRHTRTSDWLVTPLYFVSWMCTFFIPIQIGSNLVEYTYTQLLTRQECNRIPLHPWTSSKDRWPPFKERSPTQGVLRITSMLSLHRSINYRLVGHPSMGLDDPRLIIFLNVHRVDPFRMSIAVLNPPDQHLAPDLQHFLNLFHLLLAGSVVLPFLSFAPVRIALSKMLFLHHRVDVRAHYTSSNCLMVRFTPPVSVKPANLWLT